MERCVVSLLLKLLTISAVSVTLVNPVFLRFRLKSEIKINPEPDSDEMSDECDTRIDLKESSPDILRLNNKTCDVDNYRISDQVNAKDKHKDRWVLKKGSEEDELTSSLSHLNITMKVSDIAEFNRTDFVDSFNKLNNTDELYSTEQESRLSGHSDLSPEKVLNLSHIEPIRSSDELYENTLVNIQQSEEHIGNHSTVRFKRTIEVSRNNYTFELLSVKDVNRNLIKEINTIRDENRVKSAKVSSIPTACLSGSLECGSLVPAGGAMKPLRALVGVIVTMGALLFTDKRS